MKAILADDFNRANGALGSNWATAGSGAAIAITSNEARGQDNFLESFAYWNGAFSLPNTNYEVSVDMTMVHGTEYADGIVLARYVDTSNWYGVLMWTFGDEVQIVKRVGGVDTTIASTPFNFNRNTLYNIKIRVMGDLIRAYVDDTLVLSVQDTDLSAVGKPGLFATGHPSAYMAFDNFMVNGKVYLTSWRKPTATNSSVDSGGATVFDNVWLDDGNYAAFNALNDQGTYQTFGDFAIPANANLLGVEVKVEGKITGAGINHLVGFGLRDGAVYWSGDNSDFDPTSTSDELWYLGDVDNLWGNTGFVVADFANGTFRVRLTCNALSATSVDIDYFEVRVAYELPEPWGSLLQMFQ